MKATPIEIMLQEHVAITSAKLSGPELTSELATLAHGLGMMAELREKSPLVATEASRIALDVLRSTVKPETEAAALGLALAGLVAQNRACLEETGHTSFPEISDEADPLEALRETGGLGLYKTGSRWTHHTGRVYEILGFANTKTSAPDPRYPVMIIYRNVDNGTIWSRQTSDWNRSFTPIFDEPGQA